MILHSTVCIPCSIHNSLQFENWSTNITFFFLVCCHLKLKDVYHSICLSYILQVFMFSKKIWLLIVILFTVVQCVCVCVCMCVCVRFSISLSLSPSPSHVCFPSFFTTLSAWFFDWAITGGAEDRAAFRRVNSKSAI